MSDVLHGDCLELLKTLSDNSIDAIVTDPPYGLSFMGKKWDYDVPSVEIWRECLRVLKPGGYLLSFAGTRTQHRMACNIEDAGFEIRDMIAWVYGSGFPKSLNIGKAVDKLRGDERDEVPNNRHGGGSSDIFPERNNFTTTKGTSEWEGWGTALKPALEPITVARKPLSEKTVALNCIKWGVGGINIDGCRVAISDNSKNNWKPNGYDLKNSVYDYGSKTITTEQNINGRFPANFIHDGSEEVEMFFPQKVEGKDNFKHSATSIFGAKSTGNDYNGESKSSYGSASRFFYCAKSSKSERNIGCENLEDRFLAQGNQAKAELVRGNTDFGNNGSSNGFNTVKTVKNNHPTVKPIKLMEYLVKLVTKENYTVLDPFGGSGTTALACINLNRNYILMEREKEYIDIINARIGGVKNVNKRRSKRTFKSRLNNKAMLMP